MVTAPSVHTERKPSAQRLFMWNISPSLADSLFAWSNVVLVAGAAAVLIGTIGSIKIGSIREHFADTRISENERATAQANLEAEKIKAVVAWRTIPSDLASALESALATKPGAVNLRYTDGDPEALYLAIQISRILEEAKWQIGAGSLKPGNAIIFGIMLPDTAGPDAVTLREAFTAAKIPFSPGPMPNVGSTASFNVMTIPGAPLLMIGSRPPPQIP